MQVQPQLHRSDPKLVNIANTLQSIGWLGGVAQLGFAIAIGLMLLFAIAGRSFSQATGGISPFQGVAGGTTIAGMGIGIFWAIAGIVALLVSAYLAFRLTRYARQLRNPIPEAHPRKAEVMRLLRMGVVVGLVGMLLTIIGAAVAIGVLLAKSVAQPQGVTIYDSIRIIRSLDIFVAAANTSGITAHFFGTLPL